jgi:hypothetical protein
VFFFGSNSVSVGLFYLSSARFACASAVFGEFFCFLLSPCYLFLFYGMLARPLCNTGGNEVHGHGADTIA